ncbi:heterokaryon incompatibility protein-domain-containing protein [Xylariaceae sp. FL0804]|nr:heterokaryon incompatibility protein-domain-containing protein [Xylariaceae sp. FL0804]
MPAVPGKTNSSSDEWRYNVHARFATTRLHQALRDGISDTVAMHGMQWKRRDINRTFDRSYKRRVYQHARAAQPPDPADHVDEFHASQQNYSYTVLERDDDIRLLRLLPGTGKSPIACELVAVSHETQASADPVLYEALSYTWGPNIPHTIRCADASLTISENLWLALQTLRHRDTPRVLWVDAVCINQQDNEEKGKQVARMRSIYEHAAGVVVWLGEATKMTGSAFGLIHRLEAQLRRDNTAASLPPMTAADLETANLPPVDDPVWKGLDEIFWREWHFRAWILQEVSVEKDIVVTCGPHSVSWDVLAGAVAYIEGRAITSLTRADPKPLRDVLSVARQAHSGMERGGTLFSMLSVARDSDSTDARDKVFAILALVDQATENGPRELLVTPDYTKGVEDVYVDVAVKHIMKHQDLDILSAVENNQYRLNTEMPSWVPDWQTRPPSTPFYNLDGFGDWKASGATKASPTSFRRDEPSTCTVRGSVIDVCTHIADTFLDRLPSSGTFKSSSNASTIGSNVWQYHMQRRWRQWEKMGEKTGPQYLSGESVQEAYAQTLVASQSLSHKLTEKGLDSDSDNYYTAIDGYRAFREFWQRVVAARGQLNSAQLENLLPQQLQQAIHFMEAHKMAAYGRRFFITKKGYMGLCHPTARAGDLVVLLAGGKTPYVLKSKLGIKKAYYFIGECYLHGVMQGEAMADANGGAFENEQCFRLH